MQEKEALPYVLAQIRKRYCSIFFSKLVLLDEENSSHQDNIRHYDIQCEAVEMIADIVQTKIKAIMLKSFENLKQRATTVSWKMRWKKNPASTNYNGYSGYSGRKNLATDNKFLQHYPSTTRLNHRNIVYPPMNEFEDQSDPDESLSALMGKVRHLHSRFRTKNDQIEEDVYSERLNSKLEKRRLILSKISRLEYDISEMLEDEEDLSCDYGYNLQFSRSRQTNYGGYDGIRESRSRVNKTFTVDRGTKQKTGKFKYRREYN